MQLLYYIVISSLGVYTRQIKTCVISKKKKKKKTFITALFVTDKIWISAGVLPWLNKL